MPQNKEGDGMAYDIGPKIGIEGEKEFRSAITSINTQLKTLKTEMQAVTSAYDKNDTSVGKLTARQRVLTQQVDLQLKKLLAMREGLDQAKQKYGENSDVTQKWQQQVNKATAELNGLEHELQDNSSALEMAKQAADGYASAEEEAARAAKELEQAQQAAAERVAQMSDKLQKAAVAMQAVNRAALTVAAGVAALGAASAKVGMDFEAQMSKVEAISGATVDEMVALTAKAQEMGATTKFTATESGQALEYMAMAGWKSGQMIDGLPGIMNLAAASGEDLASVSDIVTDALTAFGLAASDSAHFADVLAQASSSSNTNVAMMGETFKTAAPVAGALGYSIDDVAVAIGLMANAGVKGERAGTALRGMLTNLAKPSDQIKGYMDDLGLSLTDTAGNMKPLNKLLVEMRQKFARLTDAQKAEYAAGIAGKEAMSGLLAVVNAGDTDFDKLTKAIGQSDGTAKRMADTMNKNLKGQLTLLGSAAEGAGIALYDKFAEPAAEAVGELAEKVGEFAEKLSSGELDSKLNALAAAGATAATAIIGLNAALMVKDVANFAAAVKAGGAALQGYTAATKAGAVAQGALNLVQALSPMGALAAAASAVVLGLAVYVNKAGLAETETDRLSRRVDDLTESYKDYKKEQQEINQRRDEALNNSMAELNHVKSMTAELSQLTDKTGKVNEGEKDRARVLANMINEIMPGAVSWIEKEGEAYAQTAQSLDALLHKEQLKAWLDANQEGYQAAIQGQQGLIDKVMETSNVVEEEQKHIADLQAKQQQVLQTTGDVAAFDEFQRQIDESNIKLNEAKTELDVYERSFVESANTISQYESNKAALLSGEEAKIRAALEDTTLDLRKYTGHNLQELKQQASDAEAAYNWLLDMAQRYPQEITREQLDEAKSRADQAKTIADQAGREEIQALAVAMESQRGEVETAAQEVAQAGEAGAETGKGGFVTAGENAGNGYAQGIRNTIRNSVLAANDLVYQTVAAVNNAQDSHSPSRVTMKSGLWFDLGYAKGIEDNSDKAEDAATKMSKNVLSAANEWLDEQKFYNRLAIGDEVDFWQQMTQVAELKADELKEVYKKLYTAKSSASKDSLENSRSWIEKEKFYNRLSAEDEIAAWKRVVERKNLLAEEQMEAERELYSLQRQVLDEYAQSLQTRVDALGSYAGLFDEITKDSDITGHKLLSNLKDQVQAFEDWQADMETLASKGVTGPLLEELQQLGPSAAQEIHALSTLTEKELQEYADTYTKKAALIAEQAQKELGTAPLTLEVGGIDVSDAVNDSGANAVVATLGTTLVTSLATALKNKAADLTGAGSKTIQDVTTGMAAGTPAMQETADQIMQDSADLIAGYEGEMRSVGRNLMAGVAQGVLDGKSGVVNAVRQALEAAARAARQAMDIHSPSRVFAEIGDFMGQGIGVGFIQRMKSVAREIADSIPVPVVESQTAAAERTGEAVVNGIAAAMQGGAAAQSTIIIPVYLDGRQIAQTVYDPLKQVGRQRGDS